jgi:hypothetical protein
MAPHAVAWSIRLFASAGVMGCQRTVLPFRGVDQASVGVEVGEVDA